MKVMLAEDDPKIARGLARQSGGDLDRAHQRRSRSML